MGNLQFQHWLIGQGLAFLVLMIFGLVVKLILEKKQERSISSTMFFVPMILGYIFAFTVQYLLLFGGQ